MRGCFAVLQGKGGRYKKTLCRVSGGAPIHGHPGKRPLMRHRSSLLRRSFFGVLALTACSSGGGSGQTSASTAQQAQQLCVSACNKAAQCDDAGASAASGCSNGCSTALSSSTIPTSCNFNAYMSAANACLQQSCSPTSGSIEPQYIACLVQAEQADDCSLISVSSSTSTGASSSSSIPTDGGASCALCDKAGACCSALQTTFGTDDAGDCAEFTAAMCNSRGASSSAFATDCQAELSAGQELGVAACN